MEMNRILGAAIFVTGAVLLGFAYAAANAPLEEYTGHYSNETMWFYTIGIAAVIGGGLHSTLGDKN
ncbi:MAG: DUF3185 family protein [Alphaproteobacteria bacterium]|nr:DUF3185 family protein [Alphaproteobacteria bacterium]